MDTLLYATPTGRHPTIQYVQSMRAMEMGIRSFGERRVEDFVFTSGPVQMARTKASELALTGRCFEKHDHHANGGTDCSARPYDYLLMHDDDLMVQPFSEIGSPVDVWHDLFKANPDVGVIGAVYLRERPLLPNVVVKHPTDPTEVVHVVARLPNAPMECAGVATGFMMVRREVLERLAIIADEEGALPMFRFAMRQRPDGMVAEDGEDYDFCKRVTKAGFKVVADPRFTTVHVKDSGQLEYSWEGWEARWAEPDPSAPDYATQRALTDAVVRDLRGQCAPAMKLSMAQNCLVLDHLDHRKVEAERWQMRLAHNKAREAA